MHSFNTALGFYLQSGLILVGLATCQWRKQTSAEDTSLKQHQAIEHRIDSTLKTIQPTDTTHWKNGMVFIKDGTFIMGSDNDNMPDTKPLHTVTLSDFWLDATPVTNEQFTAFVNATGYKTVAERPLNPKDFPGVPKESLVPGSIVFQPPAHAVTLNDPSQWWKYIAGAYWREPEGSGSNIENRNDHPVVHVCYEDARAYCAWAGKRLPTEAEFEFAARGGSEQNLYAWGNELTPGNKWPANIWQGNFPNQNSLQDGFLFTSPVHAFAPNAFGLYDISGNVWQWCNDWYAPDYYAKSDSLESINPKGALVSFDPYEPGVAKKVQRSGSFLCSDQYCVRYLVGSRGKGEVFSSSSNVGFRCAR
jgi:formylglycine-generating enzyme